MKQQCIALFVFGSCLLNADEPEQQSLWHYHPLHVGGQFIRLGKADCSDIKPTHRHDIGNVIFHKSNAFVSMMLPINQNNIFFPQLQYNWVKFDWSENLKFNETNFSYLQFDVLYYCTGLEHWRWIARFDYSIQSQYLHLPGRYSLYNGLLWGAYQLHRKWHYHIGALGYAGMQGYDIIPIIGLDFTPGKHWFMQAIFPVNYSIEYKISDWTFAIKGRPLKERLRAGKHEPQPRSVFCYSSMGSEFNIHFERQFKLTLEAYAGYNFGGHFYIKNSVGKRAEYVNFDGSIYAGASLDYGF